MLPAGNSEASNVFTKTDTGTWFQIGPSMAIVGCEAIPNVAGDSRENTKTKMNVADATFVILVKYAQSIDSILKSSVS